MFSFKAGQTIRLFYGRNYFRIPCENAIDSFRIPCEITGRQAMSWKLTDILERMNSTITPREYAAKHKVPYSTVLTWIKTGKLSANKQTTPHGIFYSIEKNTARPMTRRGPKLKGKTT